MEKITSFWKIFIAVFIAAFVANTAIAYVWSNFFHGSNWRWDVTSVTAVTAGLVVAYIMRRKK